MSSGCPSCQGRAALRSNCAFCGGGGKKKAIRGSSGADAVSSVEAVVAAPEFAVSSCRACRKPAELCTPKGQFCSTACASGRLVRLTPPPPCSPASGISTPAAMEFLGELLDTLPSLDITATAVEEEEEGGETPEEEEDETGDVLSSYKLFTQLPLYGVSSLGWYEVTHPLEQHQHSISPTLQIAYQTQGKQGPIVVLLPALGVGRQQFQQLQALLSPFCRTLALDLLHSGDSSRLHGEEDQSWLQRESDYLDDLLQQLYPDQAFNLCGSEWGGSVALLAASRLRGRVASLALLQPVPELRAAGRSRKVLALERCEQGDCRDFQALREEELGRHFLPLSLQYESALLERATAPSPSQLLPYDPLDNEEGLDPAALRQLPCFIAYSAEGQEFQEALAQSLPSLYRMSRYLIQPICGARHLPSLDEPRRLAQAYLNFLQGFTQQLTTAAYLGYPAIPKGDEKGIVTALRRQQQQLL